MKTLNLLCFWDGDASDLICLVLGTFYFFDILIKGRRLKSLDNQIDLSCLNHIFLLF